MLQFKKNLKLATVLFFTFFFLTGITCLGNEDPDFAISKINDIVLAKNNRSKIQFFEFFGKKYNSDSISVFFVSKNESLISVDSIFFNKISKNEYQFYISPNKDAVGITDIEIHTNSLNIKYKSIRSFNVLVKDFSLNDL